jgi:F-type H+-transporting ATPase subunit b
MRKISFTFFVAGLLLMPAHALRAQSNPAVAPQASTAPSLQHVDADGAEREIDENDVYRHSAMVKKVGAALGLTTEQSATAFEVFNFAVLALLVLWVLARTLPKALRNRSGAIQKDLADARSATEEAASRLGGVEARLAKLDEQIAAMRAQSEKDSAADEQRIKAGLEDAKKKILAAADQEIAAATTHARRQLQQYAAELAIDQAAQKLVVTAETDRLLVQSFAARLAGEDPKSGEN